MVYRKESKDSSQTPAHTASSPAHPHLSTGRVACNTNTNFNATSCLATRFDFHLHPFGPADQLQLAKNLGLKHW